jgi:two-component system, chemotaxis family, response regulator Rcp1
VSFQPIRPHTKPQEHRTPESGSSITSDSPKELLLLVEDNGADVFLVEQALEFFQVPLRLEVAEDGEVACQYFEKADQDSSIPCPRVLLLDLNLPKRSGADVLEQVRKSNRCRNVPVVVLTSSDSPEDRQRAASLGADRYFRKPTSYREFLQIGAVLNEVLNETASTAKL